MASVDVSGIPSFAAKYQKEIILQFLMKLENQGLTLEEDISTSTRFPKFIVDSALQPYSETFEGAGSLVLSDRELTTAPAKDEYLLNSFEFEKSYLRLNQKAATAIQIPYENYFWQQVVGKISDNLIRSTIWKGDTTDVTTNKAIRICDGFKKIIATEVAGGGLVPIVTGTPNNTNAVSKLELLYSSAINSYEALSDLPMMLYCSKAQKMNYKQDYRARYPYDGDPSTYENGTEKLYLKLAEGQNVEIKAVNWLNSINKLILTPQLNMKVGTNKLSDMNAIKIVPDVWVQKCGIRFVFGMQIADLEVCFVNDAA